MARTALIYHPDVLLHDTGEGHPEHRARLESIVQHLKDRSLWDEFLHLQPQLAPRHALLRAHSPVHLDRVADLAQAEYSVYVSRDSEFSPRHVPRRPLSSRSPFNRHRRPACRPC